MVTPTPWLNTFQVNTGAAQAGVQSDPQIIGLANGNFLVAWVEAGDAIASDSGLDIVGKIYGLEGELVRDAFQINSLRVEDGQEDFDIAATNDGGFITVYSDVDSLNSAIVWERYDQNGTSTNSAVIATETRVGDLLSSPQLAVNFIDNTSVVVFTDDVNGNDSVRGVSVTSGGQTSVEFDAAENAGGNDRDADIAILSNGRYVSVYLENDLNEPGIQASIFNADGSSLNTVQLVTSDEGVSDPQVTSLNNGNFVLAWNDNDTIRTQVFGNDGTAISAQITVDEGNQNEPEVVALPDGGFVVVWDDDDPTDEPFAILARRYQSDGTPQGDIFTVQEGVHNQPQISVTVDGRLLFTWFDGSIQASIFDPRETDIELEDYNDNLTNFLSDTIATTRIDSSTLNGTDAGDTLLGQVGDDTLNGLTGNDLIEGREGRDSLSGGLGHDTLMGQAGQDTLLGGDGDDILNGGLDLDTLNGGIGQDLFIINDSHGIDSIDGAQGLDTLDLSDISTVGQQVLINLTTETFVGLGGATSITGVENIIGTQLNDTVVGSLFDDTLIGANGNDSLIGDVGTSSNDLLDGGNGNDVLSGGDGQDTLIGGQGADTLRGQNGNDLLLGLGNNDSINGAAGNDTVNAGGGNDFVVGVAGRDLLNGSLSNDTLLGGSDRDTLVGGLGNDSLIGGTDLDILNGADNIGFGVGERDTLEGGSGTQDRYKLGDRRGVYYLDEGAGGTSFARIVDFENVDRFLLAGSSADYRLTSRDGDTFLLFRESGPDDTIALIENTTGLSLSGVHFIYI